jgi:phosphoglycerate dehydrogenase-like enzyme
MTRALYILDERSFEEIYGPEEREEVASLVELVAPRQDAAAVRDDPSLLAEVEAVVGGWNGLLFDEPILDAAPELRIVFHGAGSIRSTVTDAFWRRGVRITSAYAANARPVAEYTVSQIYFCLKGGWHYALQARRDARAPRRTGFPGAYKTTVGLISLGAIARQVRQMLADSDLHFVGYDPYLSDESFAELGVEKVGLDELFARSDAVSLHSPQLPETRGMIRGAHFEAMKPRASFINTARGSVVREEEMLDVLERRDDLTAVLDVTDPEPPKEGSRVFTLPNVIYTPHMAGSLGRECRRMGRTMVEELRRYLDDRPLAWEITPEQFRHMA